MIMYKYTWTIVGKTVGHLMLDAVATNSYLHNGNVFPNKSPHFKGDMHEVTVRRIYKSTEPKTEPQGPRSNCSNQWGQVNYTILVVHVAISDPSAKERTY